MHQTPAHSRDDRTPTAAELRAVFDAAPLYTVGIEEEVMLLDPATLALAPCAQEVIGRLDGDRRFKLELPASQLEIVLPPLPDAGAVRAALAGARRALLAACDGLVRPAAAGVHPFSPGTGELNHTARYAEIIDEYGPIANRQLVCALQVHVSVGDSARALAVYNALRSYLPLLAALAANAPFYEGLDCGLASVRPKLCELLPRQGVPPAIESWEAYAGMLRWGARGGAFREPRGWWWELRLHPGYGTLELRVPDAQSTVEDAAAMAAVIHALIARLGARHDGGERLAVAPRWRIEENRWSACRHGVGGTMADLETGERHPTTACLQALVDEVSETAVGLGAEQELRRARVLAVTGGASAQRQAARDGGVVAVARVLAERFAPDGSGRLSP
ncbi:MAG: YbdK family carboxylate-amine ligase [Solirubrobacterales bacterium]|nr:YbdK family carboxylate-amine ligase [Solirubrobacterales bacterium]